MALHNHSRGERLQILSTMLERLDDRNQEENAADVMPSAAERGSGREARSTNPQPPRAVDRTTSARPLPWERSYPFEQDAPPFAPLGITEFLNTQSDRVLR